MPKHVGIAKDYTNVFTICSFVWFHGRISSTKFHEINNFKAFNLKHYEALISN